MKREARQNYYRQMHTAAREIYEAGQADERERIFKLLEENAQGEYKQVMLTPKLIELIKGETKPFLTTAQVEQMVDEMLEE